MQAVELLAGKTVKVGLRLVLDLVHFEKLVCFGEPLLLAFDSECAQGALRLPVGEVPGVFAFDLLIVMHLSLGALKLVELQKPVDFVSLGVLLGLEVCPEWEQPEYGKDHLRNEIDGLFTIVLNSQLGAQDSLS